MQDLPPLAPPVLWPEQPHALHGADARDAVRHWQALLDARLIGNVSPPGEATLAAIRHNERVLFGRVVTREAMGTGR